MTTQPIPKDTCPVIGEFLLTWAAGLPESDEIRLALPFTPRVIGSKSTDEVQRTRAAMAAQWLTGVFAPAWLREAGFIEQARKLESLGKMSFDEATVVLRALRDLTARELELAYSEKIVERCVLLCARNRAGAAAANCVESIANLHGPESSMIWAVEVVYEAAQLAMWIVSASDDTSLGEKTTDRLQLSAIELVERMIAVRP